jgi:hypothetical protein
MGVSGTHGVVLTHIANTECGHEHATSSPLAVRNALTSGAKHVHKPPKATRPEADVPRGGPVLNAVWSLTGFCDTHARHSGGMGGDSGTCLPQKDAWCQL